MRPVDLMSRRHGARTHTYQFSLHTTKQAEAVLDDFAARNLPGTAVEERGQNYLILRPEGRRRYGGDVAAILAILIIFAVLILTAISPVFVALLPLAIVPAIPPLLDNRPDIAMSAVDEEEGGGTRVTVHGQASSELAAALDAYIGSLPRFVAPEALEAPTDGHSANTTPPHAPPAARKPTGT